MRYVIKQKLFALGEGSTIADENGQNVYSVQGKIQSFGDVFILFDMKGNEQARIEQRLYAWGPTLEITRDEELLVAVKKSHFTPSGCSFMKGAAGTEAFQAEGDLPDYEYMFLHGEKPAAWVSKQWFKQAGTYGLDVGDFKDPVLLVAATILIDAANIEWQE